MWDIIWLSSETEPLDEVCVQLTQKSEFFDTSAVHFFSFLQNNYTCRLESILLIAMIDCIWLSRSQFWSYDTIYKKIQSQRDAKGKYRLNGKYALILRSTKGTHLIE